MMPKTIVLMALQRNQNRAEGVMKRPSAGFSSSGIFGVVGAATKLKYQSSPIHITPAMTCSQRKQKSSKVRGSKPCTEQYRPTNKIASTKPAITTLRRLPRNPAIQPSPAMSLGTILEGSRPEACRAGGADGGQ